MPADQTTAPAWEKVAAFIGITARGALMIVASIAPDNPGSYLAFWALGLLGGIVVRGSVHG